jgi:hypothetical protein
MAKSNSKIAGGSNNNGGIMGSGIFGMFGTTIHCNSNEDSLYCNIMKLFNLLIVVFIVGSLLYMAYTFVIVPYMKKRK